MLSGGAAFAEDQDSANYIMPGCREYLVAGSKKEMWGGPFCSGLIRGLAFKAKGVCIAPGVTGGQVIRVVVQYIDARPARMHEEFMELALEAMKAVWPCER
jgi:hypothetical protein